jgi:hypothetical protein
MEGRAVGQNFERDPSRFGNFYCSYMEIQPIYTDYAN